MREIVFIINGEDVPVPLMESAPLSLLVEEALYRGYNLSRPLGDWDVRNSAGALLDTRRKASDYGFVDGTRLFANLQVGAGGARCAPSSEPFGTAERLPAGAA